MGTVQPLSQEYPRENIGPAATAAAAFRRFVRGGKVDAEHAWATNRNITNTGKRNTKSTIRIII